MDTKQILALPFVSQCTCLDKIDSTNTYVKQHVTPAKSGITVVTTDIQTAGRGQHGRSFYSSVNGGLWVTLVLSLNSIEQHFHANRALSLAITNALLEISPRAQIKIKWPNDIYWGDKKVCGILLESFPGKPNAIILGFGINVNMSARDFPSWLPSIATTVREETSTTHDLTQLLVAILKSFYSHLISPAQNAHELYSTRLYCVGSKVALNDRYGIFEGVEIDGRVRLRTSTGIEHHHSGMIEFM